MASQRLGVAQNVSSYSELKSIQNAGPSQTIMRRVSTGIGLMSLRSRSTTVDDFGDDFGGLDDIYKPMSACPYMI